MFNEIEEGEIMSTPFAGRGRERYRRVPAERVARSTVLNAYGPSMKDAWTVAAMGGNKSFYDNRLNDGYYGRGAYKRKKYSGRGMYSLAAPAMYAAKTGIDYAVKNPRATRKFFQNIGNKFMGRGMYTGRGEYETDNSNELMSGSDLKSPQFMSVPDESGSLMVKHREYVGDIFAPPSDTVSDFTIQAFPINPGLEQSFPWLSQIAQNYEEYELIQCVFEFVSTVQDINSSNGQVGTIITATQYNSSEQNFTDKPAMAAYAHSVSGKSTDNQTHGVECDPSKLSGSEGKYIRANPVLVGEDLKTYDHGRFQLATHNIPAAMASGTLGELYVSYTVKLRKPKFFTGRGLGLTRYLTVADQTSSGGTSTTFPFGTDSTALVARQNNLAVAVERTSGAVKLTIPAYYGGRLRVKFIIEGSTMSGSIGSGGLVFTGNINTVSDIYASGSGGTGDNPSYILQVGDASHLILDLSINVEPATNAIDNSLTLSSVVSGTINQSSIEISEHNTFGNPGAAQLVNGAGTAINL